MSTPPSRQQLHCQRWHIVQEPVCLTQDQGVLKLRMKYLVPLALDMLIHMCEMSQECAHIACMCAVSHAPWEGVDVATLGPRPRFGVAVGCDGQVSSTTIDRPHPVSLSPCVIPFPHVWLPHGALPHGQLHPRHRSNGQPLTQAPCDHLRYGRHSYLVHSDSGYLSDADGSSSSFSS
jgi:hypothetical protein